MSVTTKTYILYGTKISTDNYNKSIFEGEDDYIDYLYEVINIDESPYELIYNEADNSYYFGFVMDKARTSNWEYLSTRTFEELTNTITPDIEQSVGRLLLEHFNIKRDNCKIEHRILTVYC